MPWLGNVTCACRSLTWRHSSSSLLPNVAGLRGRRESTYCARATPPCRVISFAALKHSLKIISIVFDFGMRVEDYFRYNLLEHVISSHRSTLRICSGASSPPSRIITPFLARIFLKMPPSCGPSIASNKSGPTGPTCPAKHQSL